MLNVNYYSFPFKFYLLFLLYRPTTTMAYSRRQTDAELKNLARAYSGFRPPTDAQFYTYEHLTPEDKARYNRISQGKGRKKRSASKYSFTHMDS